jgi:hypothetical protein
VNDFLVTHLGTIDERLLFYLDEDDEMMFDTVERLRLYTNALLADSITPAALAEEWPDWYHLAPAFVHAYGTKELETLQDAAVFLGAVEEHDDVGLDEADRTYLQALELRLGLYPEIRTTTEK